MADYKAKSKEEAGFRPLSLEGTRGFGLRLRQGVLV
jgi:hypothetical protein